MYVAYDLEAMSRVGAVDRQPQFLDLSDVAR
jgi:hypothetical protein